MSKKNMDGGYGYFMSNKVAKDITTSVLKSSTLKEGHKLHAGGDYRDNDDKVHHHATSGRTTASQGHKSIFSKQTQRKKTLDGASIPNNSNDLRKSFGRATDKTPQSYNGQRATGLRPPSNVGQNKTDMDRKSGIPNLFSNNFLRKSQMNQHEMVPGSQGDNGKFQTTIESVNASGNNNKRVSHMNKSDSN